MSADTASSFPGDFVWGAATAATRSRARRDEDGRGESDLGPLLPRRPGRSANGDTGDDRVRLLPPLPRRRRAACASSASTPSASRSPGRAILPDGPRPRERRRPRLLRPARRRAARARDRAVPDALPLGPAAGARGRGRLAGASDGRGVRRVRRGRGRRASATGSAHWTTHNEPWCRRLARLRLGQARPRARPPGATRSRPRTTCCSPTGSRWRRSAATRPAREVGIVLNLDPVRTRPSDSPADARRRSPRGRLPQPLVPRPALPRRVPGRHARALRRRTRRRIERRRPRADRARRSTSSA